eukprot:gene25041-biopygen4461
MPACFGKARIARATTSYCTNYNHQVFYRTRTSFLHRGPRVQVEYGSQLSESASQQVDQANRLSNPAGLAKPSSKTMHRQVKESGQQKVQCGSLVSTSLSVQECLGRRCRPKGKHEVAYRLTGTGGHRGAVGGVGGCCTPVAPASFGRPPQQVR